MTRRTHGKLLIALCLAAGQTGAAGAEEGDGLRELAPTSILQGESETIGFGKTVALAGPRALVAGPREGYIFERDHVTGDWSQTGKLVPDEDRAYKDFGRHVALSGTRALATAVESTGGGPPVPPGGSQDSWTYLFERQDGDWQQVTTFSGGAGVSLAGDRAITAAPDIGESGAVQVHDRIDGEWTQTALLEPDPDVIPDFMFYGAAIAQSGDQVAVGAIGNPIVSSQPGMVFIYERQSDGEWVRTDVFSASDAVPRDAFGNSISMQGHRMVVGAPGSTADQDRGAVYVFERTTGSGAWTETAKLVPPDDQDVETFGISVSLSSDQVLVGVRDVLGDEWRGQGTAYLFDYEGEGWSLSATLTSPQPDGSGFGQSVSLFAGRALIGQDVIRGQSESDNSSAAYIFEGLGNSPVKPVPALGARAMTLLLLAMTAIAAAMIQRNKRAPRNAR